MLNQYETVFIMTPVLSDEQMKEAVAKFRDYLKGNLKKYFLSIVQNNDNS